MVGVVGGGVAAVRGGGGGRPPGRPGDGAAPRPDGASGDDHSAFRTETFPMIIERMSLEVAAELPGIMSDAPADPVRRRKHSKSVNQLLELLGSARLYGVLVALLREIFENTASELERGLVAMLRRAAQAAALSDDCAAVFAQQTGSNWLPATAPPRPASRARPPDTARADEARRSEEALVVGQSGDGGDLGQPEGVVDAADERGIGPRRGVEGGALERVVRRPRAAPLPL